MDAEIQTLKEQLFQAVRQAGQGSYHRRAPSKTALPLLSKVRIDLIRYMENQEPTEESWRLLAQAEETLLHYAAARRCLERAMAFGRTRAKKDLKKLALYKEYEEKWNGLHLTPERLKELGAFLEQRRQEAPFERNLKWTRTWLTQNGVENLEVVLEGLRQNGGYTDFQVLANVVHG